MLQQQWCLRQHTLLPLCSVRVKPHLQHNPTLQERASIDNRHNNPPSTTTMASTNVPPWSCEGLNDLRQKKTKTTAQASRLKVDAAASPIHSLYPTPHGFVHDTHWEQRHEDAVASHARHWGSLERRVKHAEQREVDLIAQNKSLENRVLALEHLVQTLIQFASLPSRCQ